ncbi:MAG: Ti-type conjugative transfer relaxase TraA [Rhizobiaceae bacterium]
MAIYHLHAQIIGRSEGRSAVASAAYRHCARMEIEREARVVDYSNKKGLAHSEFALPPETPAWLRTLIDGRDAAGASAAFWNVVEAFEKRSDAQFMREMDLALPLEFSREQNIELVRAFVADHITSRGMIADWAYHDIPGNPHIHLMTTLRPLTEEGFGPKRVPVVGVDGKVLRVVSKEHPKGKIVYRLWAGDETTLREWREAWASLQNVHLAKHGFDVRVDHRSFADRGIELEPTLKLGVGTKHIASKSSGEGWASELDRLRLFEEARQRSAGRIVARPAIVLEMVARERSVFDERDLAKLVHRYVDDAGDFTNVMAAILADPEVVKLQDETFDLATGTRVKSRLAIRTMIRTEAEMVDRAIALSGDYRFGVESKVRDRVFADQAWLHDEQKAAIDYVTGSNRIAAIVGLAGAGKTTALKAAREIWEQSGYRVVGAALAGKAAEGLEQEAGITSRTLASWELAWSQARNTIDDKTVFVLDEAGMVASQQMARFAGEVAAKRAKLVLVGDDEQLQPIEAGAAFRAIHDRVGYVVLENIRRQKTEWMRAASVDLARGRVADALKTYRDHGKVLGSATKREAMTSLIADWTRDYDPNKSSLILAHLRRDVRMLNELARLSLIERGVIAGGHRFETEDGVRNFATGDQIVFLRNETSLGVKNGMIGRVIEASAGKIAVEVGDDKRRVEVAQAFYRNVDHGYATTVHKSQGATVDQVKVLASLSLDKHLTYVAMTRHRHDVSLYYGERAIAKAGGLETLLARRNVKETTLDYVSSVDYRAALRYATTRGLHTARVARSLLDRQLKTIATARQKLAGLGERLTEIAARIVAKASASPVPQTAASDACKQSAATQSSANASRSLPETSQQRIAVPAMRNWRQSIPDTVKEKLMSDEALKSAWREVSSTFARVYRDPQGAASAMKVDAIVDRPSDHKQAMEQLAANPAAFGELAGKSGLLASKADRETRRLAEEGGAVLRRGIESYAALKAQSATKLTADETAARQRASIDIPALSAAASVVMERVRDAIDRNDLPAALGFALADKMVKAEIDRVGSAVNQRFGGRSLLGLDAKSIEGHSFKAASADLASGDKVKLAEAWPTLRAIQQVTTHEKSVNALKQAETVRLTQSSALKARQ